MNDDEIIAAFDTATEDAIKAYWDQIIAHDANAKLRALRPFDIVLEDRMERRRTAVRWLLTYPPDRSIFA